MKDRIPNRPLIRLLAPILWSVFQGATLGGCEGGRLAGTSVGTGNPQVVTLGFRAGAAAARVSGEVSLYAVDHNPLVDSLPLASFMVDAQDSLELDQETLLTRLRRSDDEDDSDFHVNVLLHTRDGRGAWHSGLDFALRSGRLRCLHSDPRLDLAMVPLDSFHGTMDIGEGADEKRYVTIFGSPFHGRVADCGFALDSIPRGRYEARLVRFGKDMPIVGDSALAPVHALDDSLDTQGTRPLSSLSSVIGTVLIPLKGPREAP